MFSDFQCPFCARVNPTLEALLKAHGSKIKLVWRNLPLPFHKDAQLAAEAAHEVFLQLGNAGFWKYHDALFAAQRQPDGLQRPRLEAEARKLGVNMRRFQAALDTRRHEKRITADKDAAHAGGISGTPAFLIGNYYLSGAQAQGAFERLIQKALLAKP